MSADPTRALLLACLHQDPRQLADRDLPPGESAQWDELVTLAAQQRVRPLVHQRLKDGNLGPRVPDRVRSALEQANRGIGLRNLRLQGELAGLARALAMQSVRVLLLKGAHLIADVYRSVALREMNDLDILVRREHLQRTVDAVTARGYHPVKAFSIEVDTALSHHLTRLQKAQVGDVEIHWSLTLPGTAYHVDPEELWSRATPVTVAGAGMLGLSREDLLLHLCGHASYQHQFRFGLRPFCDIAATIARDPVRIDWAVLVRRAREWKWSRGVYLTLRLARELVGAAVPSEVVDALQPADLDAAVLSTATTHVFTAPISDALQPGVARLAEPDTLGSRLRHLQRRVLLPRRELAQLYGLPPASKRLRLYYILRLKDLLRRHSAPAARLLVGKDPRLVAVAERTNLLRRWLDC